MVRLLKGTLKGTYLGTWIHRVEVLEMQTQRLHVPT